MCLQLLELIIIPIDRGLLLLYCCYGAQKYLHKERATRFIIATHSGDRRAGWLLWSSYRR